VENLIKFRQNKTIDPFSLWAILIWKNFAAISTKQLRCISDIYAKYFISEGTLVVGKFLL
jgi:hypothetical protein